MNGGFGGAAFDFGDAFTGYGNNDATQDQHQQQQPNRYMQNSSHYDQFDAQLGNPALLAGLQYNPTYNSTGTTHHSFLPAPVALNDASLQHMNSTAAHMLTSHQQAQYNAPGSAFGYPLDSIQSLPSPEKLLSSTDKILSNAQLSMPANLFPERNRSAAKHADAARKVNPDQWLEDMRIKCSDVSLDPLSGTSVLKRVRNKTDSVVTSYLPCVEFLVACQQDLRAGLAAATQKRVIRHAYRDSMTPRQFYNRYLDPLPDRFYQRNKNLMESSVLNKAVHEIQKLCADSKRVEFQGCEVMKNTFLGGMKDGESWGLRKWLSKHGCALHICNDLECILRSCQDLDRSRETTRKLAERLRPLAKQALDRLKNDVPSSYQEVSTAHPYLPFFHRLESALKGMGQFDPEDDDVICIDDDDEIEEVKAKVPVKRKADPPPAQPRQKKYKSIDQGFADMKPAAKSDDEDSVIEIVDIKSPNGGNADDFSALVMPTVGANGDWECPRCTMLNAAEARRCCMCDKVLDETGAPSDDDGNAEYSDFPFDEANWDPPKTPHAGSGSVSPLLAQMGMSSSMTATQMAQAVEKVARSSDLNQHRALRPTDVFIDENFWNLGSQYAGALRLLVATLRNRDAQTFLDAPDEQSLLMIGLPSYNSMIKHPLCLRDIVTALVGTNGEGASGTLPLKSLSCWNMWRGMDLLQALDLVLLNNLAYNGKEKTKERSATNRLRRVLWEGINGIITAHVGGDLEKRRQYTPTRRGETSGFVVRK